MRIADRKVAHDLAFGGRADLNVLDRFPSDVGGREMPEELDPLRDSLNSLQEWTDFSLNLPRQFFVDRREHFADSMEHPDRDSRPPVLPIQCVVDAIFRETEGLRDIYAVEA